MLKYVTLLVFPLLLLITGCKDDDDPIIENEEELITEFVYRLEPQGGGQVVNLVFVDPDGDGGVAPTLQVSDSLMTNKVYNGTIVMKNMSDPTKTVDIGAEVKAEGVDHQFFFQPATGLDLSVSYDDTDANGKPLGLITKLTTGAASKGDFTIILRHEPNKNAAGIKVDDPAAAGGETDLQVTFSVSIGN